MSRSRAFDEIILDAPLTGVDDEAKQFQFEDILQVIEEKKDIVTSVEITKHFLKSLSPEQQWQFFDRIRSLRRLESIYMIAVSISLQCMALILQATELKILSLVRIRLISCCRNNINKLTGDNSDMVREDDFYAALSNQSNLEDFELSLGYGEVELNVDKLCEALVHIKNLKDVFLKRSNRRSSLSFRQQQQQQQQQQRTSNSISVRNLQHLANSVECLTLDNIDLTHQHCQALAEQVLCNPPPAQTKGSEPQRKQKNSNTQTTLKFLNLHNAKISNEGAILMANALMKNPSSSLEGLGLSQNGLGDVVATHLARVLESDKAILQVLDLRNNDLGYQACKELGKALETNASLSVLDLSFNKLGDLGGRILAQGLEQNRGLETLHLLQTRVGNPTLMTFGRILKRNARLRSLNLNMNDEINASGMDKMSAELEDDHFHLEWLEVKYAYQQEKWEYLDFLLKLNRLGRHEIMKSTSEADWVNGVSHASDDLSCLYFFLQSNPAIVSSSAAAAKVHDIHKQTWFRT